MPEFGGLAQGLKKKNTKISEEEHSEVERSREA